MTDQLPLGSWPLHLSPVEHPYLLPAPYQEVAVIDDRWNSELLRLRRRPVLSDMPEGRTWNVAPILPELVRDREPGSAIDLGCGNGRDAVWLAANGWNVTAVDRLPECEERVRQLAKQCGVASRVSFVTADVSTFATSRQYEVMIAHYTYVDNILGLAQQLCSEDGVLSFLTHSKLHLECFGSPNHQPMLEPPQYEFWSIDRHSSWSIFTY